jgi:predicted extracellular nuclease
MVTDVYRLRDGVFRIAGGHPLPTPTEVARPGKEADRQRKLNGDNNLYVQLADGDDAVFPIGTELVSDTGVLGHDGKGPRLLLEEPVRLLEPPAPVIKAPRKGYVRVVSLNLQNYFNGDGRGNGFPTPRGAKTPQDFEQQRKRFRAALKLMQPHIVGVMELENDGHGRGSAALDFLADLEAATGERWEVARPQQERTGTDEIAVGIFYQPDAITAVGPAQLLNAAPFDLLNRVPINQLFEHPGSGQRFWLSINHFKSKGSCPDQGRDRDQRDGQGCWNSARLLAAKALRPWLTQQAAATADGRALLMGDLNAYRIEEPVQHFISERWSDLTAAPVERHNFSYSFRGETGTLDHALATQAMSNVIAQASILHINSPYPPGMRLKADHLRSSDHDPVLVDLRFIQSSTSN